MNMHYIHDIIRCSEIPSNLFERERSEPKTMDEVHGIIKRSEFTMNLFDGK